MRGKTWITVLTLLALALAGCSGGSDTNPEEQVGNVEVTETTGGIRGVVVDGAIQPVSGATVRLQSGGETTSDEAGAFFFNGLEPGTYFLTASKIGYTTAQSSTEVVAGVPDPDIVKLVIDRIPGKEPFLETLKFSGFYECAFGGNFGVFLITDTCDFAVRTAADGLNETVGNPGVPRGVQNNVNTEYYDIAPSAQTIVEEMFWDDPNTQRMMMLLSSTPIDNTCDCSETDYIEVISENPAYGRIDRSDANGTFPEGKVAVRGFLDWSGDLQTATNLKFQIITSIFHNYEPEEGWTFETRDQYPVPE